MFRLSRYLRRSAPPRAGAAIAAAVAVAVVVATAGPLGAVATAAVASATAGAAASDGSGDAASAQASAPVAASAASAAPAEPVLGWFWTAVWGGSWAAAASGPSFPAPPPAPLGPPGPSGTARPDVALPQRPVPHAGGDAGTPRPHGSWTAPAPGAPISLGFGVPDDGYAAGYHTGVDFAVPTGTPVHAVADARVVAAGAAGAYGEAVTLALPDGRFALYAHLSRIGVGSGQRVHRGQVVGRSGETGNADGPHLHFEIRTADAYGDVVDPVHYLTARGVHGL